MNAVAIYDSGAVSQNDGVGPGLDPRIAAAASGCATAGNANVAKQCCMQRG